MRKQAAPQLVPRTRSKTSNHQAAAETAREPAGPAFQRLTAELAAQQALVAEWAAEAAAQQARADELQAQLAEARQELARAEQAAQDGQQKCRPLERELREGNQASGAGTDGIQGGEQGGDGTDPRVAC